MNDDALSASCTPSGEAESPEPRLPTPPNALVALKPLKDWFTFENRCLVCGRRYHPGADDGHKMEHLGTHVQDGVLVKQGSFYEQVKADPVGFPGILLPKELEWSK